MTWAGDPRPHDRGAHRIDRRRSLPLDHFAPLGAIPGVSFISLQKGPAAAQSPPPGLSLTDWSDELVDFADTAALIAGLDLVITVDTSIAHLAGALGKPVWVLSRYDGCWRWLQNRDDSPWYPTLRLFRQTKPGTWAEVIATLATTLKAEVGLKAEVKSPPPPE